MCLCCGWRHMKLESAWGKEGQILGVLVLVATGDIPAPISQQSLERCGGPVSSECLPFSGTHSAAPLLVLPGPSTATGTKPMFSVTETLRAAWSDRDVSSCGTQGYQMKAPRYIIRPSSGEVLSSGWRRCLTWKSLIVDAHCVITSLQRGCVCL